MRQRKRDKLVVGPLRMEASAGDIMRGVCNILEKSDQPPSGVRRLLFGAFLTAPATLAITALITLMIVGWVSLLPTQAGVPGVHGLGRFVWFAACWVAVWLAATGLTATLGITGDKVEWWVLDSCDEARAVLKVEYDVREGIAIATLDKHAIRPKSKRRRSGPYAKALRRWVGRAVDAKGVEIRAEAVWLHIPRYRNDGLHVTGHGPIPFVTRKLSSKPRRLPS